MLLRILVLSSSEPSRVTEIAYYSLERVSTSFKIEDAAEALFMQSNVSLLTQELSLPPLLTAPAISG